MSPFRALVLLILVLTGCNSAPVFRLAHGPLERLESRLTTYADERGRQVLVPAMVHIADPAFYTAVERSVSGCERVFVEGVSGDRGGYAADAPASDAEEPVFEIGAYPRQAARLGLAEQPTVPPGVPIERLRWADMSWQEIDARASPQERKLLSGQLLDPRAFADGAGGGLHLKVLNALLEGLMASTRAEMADGLLINDDMPEFPTLLGARNARVVDAALAAFDEPGVQRVAILYGAAHARGISELLASHGFAPQSEDWLTVFAIDDREAVPSLVLGDRDILVLEYPGESGFAVELARTAPLKEFLRASMADGESLAEACEQIAIQTGDGVLVRVRRPDGAAVKAPLADGAAVRIALVGTADGTPNTSISSSRRSLSIGSVPVGMLTIQPRLGPGFALSIADPAASVEVRIEADADGTWRVLPPPGREPGVHIKIETGANRGRAYLERCQRPF